MPTWTWWKRAYSCLGWTGLQHHHLEQLRRGAYWLCVCVVCIIIILSGEVKLSDCSAYASERSAVKRRRRRGWRHNTAQAERLRKAAKGKRAIDGQPASQRGEVLKATYANHNSTHRFNPHRHRNLTSPLAIKPGLTTLHSASTSLTYSTSLNVLSLSAACGC